MATGSGRCLPTFRRPTSKVSCGFWPKPRCLRAGRSVGLEARNSEMDIAETLSWPFFDDGHRRFAAALTDWADATLPALPHGDIDAACRARVKALGEAGFLKAVVPAEHGGLHPRLDVRTLCLAREILAARD